MSLDPSVSPGFGHPKLSAALLGIILALCVQRSLLGQRHFSSVVPYGYSSASDPTFRPFDGPKPLVVSLWDHITHDTVIGGATPDVVLYEDGTLVYRKFGKGSPLYLSQQLSEDQLSELKRRFLPVLGSREIEAQYDITPNLTSMPRTCFLFSDGERQVITQVRGLYTPLIQPPPPNEFIHEVSADGLPTELVDAHGFLCSLRTRHGTEWIPKYVEVLLWPHRREVRGKVVKWPTMWPNFGSSRALTVRNAFGNRDIHAIFLPGDCLSDVQELLSDDVEAVELGGQQWQFAFRHVFPGEDHWRTAFNQTLIEAMRKKHDG